MCGSLTILPIRLYNGKRGRTMGRLWYAFYPAHMLVLWGLSLAMH